MTDLPDEYLKALGPDLGAIYQALSDDVTWLHFKWKQYQILFAESPERIDLLNGVAGAFFRVVQDAFWHDVMIHIARLTDPKTSGKDKDNLSLLQLASSVSEHTKEISFEIDTLVSEAQKAAAFVKDWRDRRIAHMDLKLLLGQRADGLPGIAREEIELFLASLRKVLNKIENHFWERTIGFEYTFAQNDAERLVYYLKRGIEGEQ